MLTDAIIAYGQQITTRIFKNDRSVTVGASEVGMCARRVRWLKDVGDKSRVKVLTRWGATLRGNLIEEHVWVPALRKKWGNRFLMGGEDQDTLVHGYLSATPDGLLVNLTPEEYRNLTKLRGSGAVVVECKSIDPRVSLTEVKAQNAFQVQVQMGIIRKKTKFKPSAAVVSYINASFLDDVTEFVVPFDPEVFSVAERRAKMVMECRDATLLRPEGIIEGGKECQHCQFTDRCGRARENAVPADGGEVSDKFRKEVVERCRQIKKLTASIEETEAKVNLLKQELKERMSKEKVRWIEGVVSWSRFAGRTSYDMDKLREELKLLRFDLEKYRKPGTPGDRMQIV